LGGGHQARDSCRQDPADRRYDATPLYFFKSKDFGVDIEVLSSTKYVSGGATTVGGIIIDNGTYNWAQIPKLEKEAKQFGPFTFLTKLKREVYRNLGTCLSPHNAYLQSLGLETLALRADRSCRNADLGRIPEQTSQSEEGELSGTGKLAVL
jgi:O-acetylhomoserine (thiol)-lyase